MESCCPKGRAKTATRQRRHNLLGFNSWGIKAMAHLDPFRDYLLYIYYINYIYRYIILYIYILYVSFIYYMYILYIYYMYIYLLYHYLLLKWWCSFHVGRAHHLRTAKSLNRLVCHDDAVGSLKVGVGIKKKRCGRSSGGKWVHKPPLYVPSLWLPRCFASALKKSRVVLPAAVLMAVGAPQLCYRVDFETLPR